MGQSTNAILAFGFDLGSTEDLPQSLYDKLAYYDNDHEAMLLDHYGSDADCAQDISKIPVEIIEHCSCDYPMYFLAVRGTKQVARRGHPQPVAANQNLAAITPATLQALKDFCTRHDIEWQDPKWYIFSMWN